MKTQRWMAMSLFVVLTLILAACVAPPTLAAPQPTPTTGAPAEPGGQIANPAAVYCGEQGGRSEIRTGADGSQTGVCVFPDGSECDEWAFYRQECAPAGQSGGDQPQTMPALGTVEPLLLSAAHPEEGARVVELLRAQWAAALGVDPAAIELARIEDVVWGDSCLGLGQAHESCLAAETPGFRVILRSGDQNSTYHTDLTGEQVREETAGTGPQQ